MYEAWISFAGGDTLDGYGLLVLVQSSATGPSVCFNSILPTLATSVQYVANGRFDFLSDCCRALIFHFHWKPICVFIITVFKNTDFKDV